MLANLLLITPVFYALLMFRTSKAEEKFSDCKVIAAPPCCAVVRQFSVHCPNVSLWTSLCTMKLGQLGDMLYPTILQLGVHQKTQKCKRRVESHNVSMLFTEDMLWHVVIDMVDQALKG